MKRINDLFNNVDSTTIDSILKKYGIIIPNNFNFSRISIVIGTNGSGKTRFLNAVKELCLENKEKVIYGYFPKLLDTKVSVPITEETLPEATLFEALYDEYDFEDFLQEIQNQNESFLFDLLNYHSKAQKNRNEKIKTSFSETFSRLTGYSIIFENKKILLERNSITNSLDSVLQQFSPGQLMLFYLSIFISLQKNNSQKTIILDEPECHLHPNALLEFINKLVEMNCFSNLYIATHSLFLVPEFEFENIIYLNESSVIPRNSTMYHNLLNDMIGENYTKKMQFFANINLWQYSQYIAECFTNPEVIDQVNAEDEQVRLFIEYISKKEPLRILDFGAGSARLGRSLRAANFKPKKAFHYDVYDINPPKDKHGFQYFDSFDGIPKKHYDCIVMMNALHEIEPLEWAEIFHSIYQVMSDESYLVFVETSILSKGELPNNTGYLVLGNDELQKLFRSEIKFPSIVISESQKSICLIIKKQYLKNISQESVFDAIKVLELNAYSKLITERSSKTYSRRYAFYTQLFLNAKIFNDNAKVIKRQNKSSIINKQNILKLSMTEKSDLSMRILLCLDSIDYTDIREINARNHLNELLRSIKYHHSVSNDSKEYIWKMFISLEQMNFNRTLISLTLLSLILTDYQIALNRFINNNYYKYLPIEIKTALKNTLLYK